ncbi:MAG: hypothetical protein ACN4GM_16875 [Gammaproteobacteria bacterium]
MSLADYLIIAIAIILIVAVAVFLFLPHVLPELKQKLNTTWVEQAILNIRLDTAGETLVEKSIKYSRF